MKLGKSREAEKSGLKGEEIEECAGGKGKVLERLLKREGIEGKKRRERMSEKEEQGYGRKEGKRGRWRLIFIAEKVCLDSILKLHHWI